MLGLLDPHRAADSAARAFTDIRVITALLHMSWPVGRELVDPGLAAAVEQHVGDLSASARGTILDQQPGSVLAAAGLLTAALAVLDSPDAADVIARHSRSGRSCSPSESPWARVVDRHYPACSPAVQEAAEQATRVFRRLPGTHGPKAPARAGGYRPEHIPAILEQRWYDEHLARLGYPEPVRIRRAGAILLVQWAAGESFDDAARYLSVGGAQEALAGRPSRWLRRNGSDDLTAALRGIASQLDHTPGLVDYHRRRQAMRGWHLDPGAWRDLTDRMPPPAPGRAPIMDDRKRQAASALIWARVTGSTPRFAPRPIEAMQPEPVRNAWARDRAGHWLRIISSRSGTRLAALHALLTRHADQLARDIDSGTAT
jgi:hypothetical protein